MYDHRSTDAGECKHCGRMTVYEDIEFASAFNVVCDSPVCIKKQKEVIKKKLAEARNMIDSIDGIIHD